MTPPQPVAAEPHRAQTPGSSAPRPAAIEVRGARQNNLSGIDVDIPLGKLTVITGPSGSGKSSLAFDTIYAEGQRRYIETFSPYTRQFFERMDKPLVDDIRGIPPAIAIEQSNNVRTTRSTVGTMTEINDYLKLFWPRLATASCPGCGADVRPDTPQSVAATAVREWAGRDVLVCIPLPVPANTDIADFFSFLKAQGFLRIRVYGKIFRTDEPSGYDRKALPGIVDVVQDRVTLSAGEKPAGSSAGRFHEALEHAFHFGKGQVRLIDAASGEIRAFSRGWHCPTCDIALRAPTPALFSFNNPIGACPKCRGFGRVIGLDLDRAMPDKTLSIRGGLVRAFQGNVMEESQKDLIRCAKARGVDLDTPFDELPVKDQRWIVEGDRKDAEEAWRDGEWYGVRGFFRWAESRAYKMHVRVFLSRYRTYTTCDACEGGRLQPEALNFKVDGRTLPDWWRTPVNELAASVRSLETHLDAPTELLRAEIASRLSYLDRVGLGYLTLDRAARTLSGGEVERVNLTSCLGASLVNTLFVMDEPSVGLHPRDVGRMIDVMRDLRDRGNTLLVVEHEESVIRAADELLDIGPGRGRDGGNLVYQGPLPDQVGYRPQNDAASLTLSYLSGKKSIPLPGKRRKPKTGQELRIVGATRHNIRKLDVAFPLGLFVCLTGVSGSGKSTLVHDVLYENLLRLKGETSENEPGHLREIVGAEKIAQVIMVDQSPLSRTPRSAPALYLGAFEGIRALFAALPDAKADERTPSFFSFNSGTGRCQRCSGAGFEKVEMQFLSDLFVKCPACDGRRYTAVAQQYRLDGKSIADVLEMTVAEAIPFFADKNATVSNRLQLLADVGLDYLALGQPLNTLSGGESQRLKLVSHMVENRGSRTLLIFDEPTTGLHFDDVKLLLEVFQRLVDQGHSLLIIEHNGEVIKCADWVIDLGPEAGVGGGKLVCEGPPERIAACEESHTGRYLRELLDPGSARLQEMPPMRRRGAGMTVDTAIRIHGAREHNLKNISVDIPRDQFVVVTGLSGSGKSTLAFDILFAEGQRRFLDSMSAYARQFVEQLERPDVDHIEGLPPTVAIEQRLTRGGGKSTVATVTEVYHFLRLLYSKVGTQHCPDCHGPVTSQTPAEIAAEVGRLAEGGPIAVMATVIKARKGFHDDVAKAAARQNFAELRVDGAFLATSDFRRLERFKEHTIEVVVARFPQGKPSIGAVAAAVDRALEVGKGTLIVADGKAGKKPAKDRVFSRDMVCPDCGRSFEPLDPRLFSFNSPHGWCPACRGFGTVPDRPQISPDRPDESQLEAELRDELRHESDDDAPPVPCPACEGSRLNEVARAVHVQDLCLEDLVRESVAGLKQIVGGLAFTGRDAEISRDILTEIGQRLHFMENVGLGYLSLNRSARTLSGGESQRIRLAAQLGSNLRGVLYVLDEPTIGLHPRDNVQLLDTLTALRDKGNSVLVVEHDEETMRRADRLLDLGPGAGKFGGHLVAQGSLADLQASPESPTGQAMAHAMAHPMRGERRPTGGGKTGRGKVKTAPSEAVEWLRVSGATANNLRNLDIAIPLRRLTAVSGVSGSGKSSFVRGVLHPAVRSVISKAKSAAPPTWKKIEGADRIDAVYEVDQSPIGKTSRSCPATYIGLFDSIRTLFAQTPMARMKGYTASRFSFNTEGGRCEACKGNGQQKLEMAFLPSSWVPCEECHGLRYNAATLEVEYNGKNIGQVMQMTIDEAADFFAPVPSLARTLRLLSDTGVGYLQLGQPSPTLSGGEAQRIKLVTELTRGLGRSEHARLRKNQLPKGSLYLIEEPTIGLHMTDVRRLIDVLHRLVDDGHTVVVIEHNLDVIAEADHVLDIGPEAGEGGGQIVASGTPEDVAKAKDSRTGPFLAEVLTGAVK